MRFIQISSIQKRLGVLFLAFLGLLVISVGVTFISLETQKQAARVINLAGRQRMLLQQMRGLALSTEMTESRENFAELVSAANTFDQSLLALQGGGSILDYTGEPFDILPPSNPVLRVELEALQAGWLRYRSNIDLLAHADASGQKRAAAGQIESQSPVLIKQAERVVRAFEADATARVNRLRAYQIAFLLAGLTLLSIGWWVTGVSIVHPLKQLEHAARLIGEGSLASSIHISGPSEVQLLSQTMETMRAQILASRQDLQQWADTLENRIRQRTRELEALSAVSQEINSHLSIEEVLTSVTVKARDLLGGDVASLCLLDEDGKVMSLHAAAAPETAIQTNHSPADHPMVGKILQHQCALPCGLQSKQGFCQIIAPAYRASHMAAALNSKGKVIGALCVGRSKPDAFRPEMVAVLTQLAGAAAVAMENSRLYQQTEYVAALEERQRIAAEMHDGLLQTLNFLRLMVGLLEEQMRKGDAESAARTLHKIRRADEQAEREIRRAIESLQDKFTLSDTLQDCLSDLANDLSAMHPPIRFESRIIRPLLLSRQEREQVLRVAREAVLNAQRHSQSELVYVMLDRIENEAQLSVKDQGIGFAPETSPADGRAHFGLKIMQARAARLGGTLSVQSSPGAGAVVQLRWVPSQWAAGENGLE